MTKKQKANLRFAGFLVLQMVFIFIQVRLYMSNTDEQMRSLEQRYIEQGIPRQQVHAILDTSAMQSYANAGLVGQVAIFLAAMNSIVFAALMHGQAREET